MLDLYEHKKFLTNKGPDLTPCTKLNTQISLSQGYVPKTTQVVKLLGVTILPPEYFSPINGAASELHINPKTYGIHWNSRLWETGLTKAKAQVRIWLGLKVVNKIKKLICKRTNT